MGSGEGKTCRPARVAAIVNFNEDILSMKYFENLEQSCFRSSTDREGTVLVE